MSYSIFNQSRLVSTRTKAVKVVLRYLNGESCANSCTIEIHLLYCISSLTFSSIMKIFSISLLALVLSSSVFAQGVAAEQGFLSIAILKDGKVQTTMPAVIGNGPGHTEIGKVHGHVQIRCMPGGSELKSVGLFSGFVIDSDKIDNKIVLTVSGWHVEDQDQKISSLKGGADCQNLGPRQIQLLKKTVLIPFVSTSSQQNMELENGYTLQWDLSIQKN